MSWVYHDLRQLSGLRLLLRWRVQGMAKVQSMSDVQEIRSFFDATSQDRLQAIDTVPWLRYEHATRYRAIDQLMDVTAGECILDAGAGSLRVSKLLLRSGGRVVALDFSVVMLEKGLRSMAGGLGPSCVQGSALLLPFADRTFDKILCTEVIEHIPGFEAVFAEFHRCLRPGGVLVITTPNWNSLYGLNRKLLEMVQRLRGRNPWPHPYDEWKRPGELAHLLSANRFRIERWIGICYLPGFSLSLLPEALQRLVIGVVQAIESGLRRRAARSGYLMGVRATKGEAGGGE